MRSGASRGNWYALFPEGEGGARSRGAGGFMQEGAGDGAAGGWLPCRFARHFVTGRGVAVKWGLRRWPPGGCCEAGAAPVVDGAGRGRFRGVMREGAEGRWPGGLCEGTAGGRRFRGIMQEGAGDGGPAGLCKRAQRGRRFRRVAAVPVCPPFRDRFVGGCCEAGLRRAVGLSRRLSGRTGGCAPRSSGGCCEVGAAPLAAAWP